MDPDDFVRHGFEALIAHRLPRYAAMAERWGVVVEADEVAEVRDPRDFDALMETAIARRRRPNPAARSPAPARRPPP